MLFMEKGLMHMEPDRMERVNPHMEGGGMKIWGKKMR
jgi:hypothetical protein